MKQKITIKDVAKEAGVSVATVSYVVNNRTDLRISDETRKKVMQVINLLDYRPNQAAKALATSKKNRIAITCSATANPFKKAEHFSTVTALSGYLRAKGYDFIFLPEDYTEKCDSADAVICYDLSAAMFHALGDNNFVPLIALDCVIGDPLFFEINSGFSSLNRTAAAYFGASPFTYVTFESPNDAKNRLIGDSFEHTFLIHSLEDIKNIPDGNLLITDYTLEALLKNTHAICFIPSCCESKMDAVLQCTENALNRVQAENHQIFV